MPTTASRIYQNSGLQPVWPYNPFEGMDVNLPGGVDYPAGQVLGAVTGAAANDVQTITITGTPDAGSIRVLMNGEITAAIAFNATAATVAAALVALPSIGAGNVTVTGGPGPGTAWVVTGAGALANRRLPVMTAINSLTGGTAPAVAVVHTTLGTNGPGLFAAYDDTLSDGTEVARALLKRRTRTHIDGTLIDDVGLNTTKRAVFVYTGGYFLTSELTGLDAAGVADLGRLVVGTTGTLTATTTILKVK